VYALKVLAALARGAAFLAPRVRVIDGNVKLIPVLDNVRPPFPQLLDRVKVGVLLLRALLQNLRRDAQITLDMLYRTSNNRQERKTHKPSLQGRCLRSYPDAHSFTRQYPPTISLRSRCEPCDVHNMRKGERGDHWCWRAYLRLNLLAKLLELPLLLGGLGFLYRLPLLDQPLPHLQIREHSIPSVPCLGRTTKQNTTKPSYTLSLPFLTYLAHVLVGLDHLREVVLGPLDGYAKRRKLCPPDINRVKCLLIAAQ
jgi:hypothetical protein